MIIPATALHTLNVTIHLPVVVFFYAGLSDSYKNNCQCCIDEPCQI